MEQQSEQVTRVQLLENTLFQILTLKREIAAHLKEVRHQRQLHPDSEPYTISEKTIMQLGQNIMEISASGRKVAPDSFSDADQKAFSLLKKLHAPIQFRREDILGDLETILSDLEQVVRRKSL